VLALGTVDVNALISRARQAADANPFLELLEAGRVPEERLRRLAGEQYSILRSDRRSFALLAARFPEPPAGDLFLSLSAGEGEALKLLYGFADAVKLSDISGYEPHPMAQAYPAYVASCAVFGTRSAICLAMLANLEEWGRYCARAADALQASYGLPEEAVAFFRFFAESPPGFADQLTAVIGQGLAAGDDPAEALRAARLLHAYETAFWASLAEGL
jgi:hypothetical protein